MDVYSNMLEAHCLSKDGESTKKESNELYDTMIAKYCLSKDDESTKAKSRELKEKTNKLFTDALDLFIVEECDMLKRSIPVYEVEHSIERAKMKKLYSDEPLYSIDKKCNFAILMYFNSQLKNYLADVFISDKALKYGVVLDLDALLKEVYKASKSEVSLDYFKDCFMTELGSLLSKDNYIMNCKNGEYRVYKKQ